MLINNLKKSAKVFKSKAFGIFCLSMGFFVPAFADTQLLTGAVSEMNLNFSSGAIIWGIFLIADLVISFGAYAATKKPSVFWSTFVLLMIIKVAVAYVITTYFPAA